jgi:hypothetical protein
MWKLERVNHPYVDTQPESSACRRSWRGVIAPVLLLVSGCVTDAQFLAQNSSAALTTAENRAKFELNCPQVASSILSQKVMDIQGVRFGYEWTEYTISVRGCGRETIYMTTCQDPSTCNAYSQTGRILPSPGGPPTP